MISQSNYIPWKGFFDSIHLVDEFIIYDTVQYTRGDWRNRNRLKTPSGPQWLTIPVKVKGLYQQSIHDTRVHDEAWGEKHWKTIVHNYANAPYFDSVAAVLEPLYLHPPSPMLSDINHSFIRAVCRFLGIETRIRWSREFVAEGEDRVSRLVDICRQVQATDYFTGPAAKNYLQDDPFREAGIQIHYFDYSGYPEYPQLFGDFVHEVSVLDLLFNPGPSAPQYLKSFQCDSMGAGDRVGRVS